MHPIFCFLGSVIRYVYELIHSFLTGKERPKFYLVCQNKSNAYLGFLLLIPLLILYLVIYHW